MGLLTNHSFKTPFSHMKNSSPLFTKFTYVIFNNMLNCNDSIWLALWKAIFIPNRIGGVMVSILASSAVDRGFEPRLGHTKNYKIGICCFAAKHTSLRRKSKNWFARNQNNVSEWSDMFTRGLLFQWSSTIKMQLSVMVYNKADIIIMSRTSYISTRWWCWLCTIPTRLDGF